MKGISMLINMLVMNVKFIGIFTAAERREIKKKPKKDEENFCKCCLYSRQACQFSQEFFKREADISEKENERFSFIVPF